MPTTIPADLRTLAAKMDKVATRMEREGLGEVLEHAVELRGAAGIARTWADGIEANKASVISPVPTLLVGGASFAFRVGVVAAPILPSIPLLRSFTNNTKGNPQEATTYWRAVR